MTGTDDPPNRTDPPADPPDRPTLATPGPAVMREQLASARRRLVHDDLADDLPRTAAELRAALRDAALPDTSPAGRPLSRRSTMNDRAPRPTGAPPVAGAPPAGIDPEATD